MIGQTISHYQVLEKLGQGGMGEVYLAQDTSLERKVALKFLPASLESNPLARKRFLREAKSAAALDHPYICDIHEVGEVEGRNFIVMEYVEGQTLRQKLNRGPISVKEALPAAMEIAEALEAAHEKGIIHRDLKPANIMFTRGGHVKVMDFGLARRVPPEEGAPDLTESSALTEPGKAPGTLAYMSPEQVRGLPLDTRSDIFAFGLVLYEMLTGIDPLKKSSPMDTADAILNDTQPPLARYVRGMPDLLEHITGKMLEKETGKRYQSVHEVRTDLSRILGEEQSIAGGRAGHRIGSWLRPVWLTGVVLILVFLIAGISWWVQSTYFQSPAAVLAFEERDWLLLTHFENLTGEDVLDGSLDTAMTVSIQQSQYVNVFPRSRVQQTLKRMRNESVEFIDEELGSEIALREGIKGLLACSIARVGAEYVMTARLLDPNTRVAVLSQSARAAGRDRILDALDQLARSIRQDLGESLKSIAEQEVPLIRATTSSLEALKAFVEARRRGFEDSAGIGLLREALTLDPEFALAHHALGGFYYRENNRPAGEEEFAKALSLLDRLTLRERLWIRADIEGWRGNREEAIGHYHAFLAQFPDELGGWFRLGYQYLILNRCEKSIEAFNRVVEIDAKEANAYINLATCFSKLDRFDEAIANYLKAFELNPSLLTDWTLNHEFGFTYVQLGEISKARETFERMLSEIESKQARGHRSLALLHAYTGRYSEAIAHLKEAVLLNRTAESNLSEFRDRLFLAAAYRIKGMNEALAAEMAVVSRLEKEFYIEPWFLLVCGRIHISMGDSGPAERLLKLIAERTNEGNRSDEAARNLLEAEMEWAQKNHAEAVSLFEIAYRLRSDNYYLAPLAHAAFMMGDLDSAIERYQQIIGKRDLGWEAQESWVLAHYFLGRAYERKGEAQRAMESYQDLLEIWETADPDLPLLMDAKKRLAELAAGS